jgi:uncharacterized protein (DUF488 family)
MNSIFTIGYEGSDIVDFIATLKIAGVKVLADVRQVTVSRKKGFSKNQLAGHLEVAGIKYFSARDLGDPKAGREAARRGDFAEFRRIYGEHLTTPPAQSAVVDLATVARAEMTCLMCYERDPETCHRRIVANQLKEYQLVPFDLFVDKKDRYAGNPEKLPSHHFGKGVAEAEYRAL